MKIGIISGSIRHGGNSDAISAWVLEAAQVHGGAEFDILDLKSFGVPLLTSSTVPAAANRAYDEPAVTAWGRAVDAHDAYIFVTPEYNHSVPGGFKNAFDSLGPEWSGKPVAFVGYGADGGVRAVEHWRTITANFAMLDSRAQLALGLFTDFDETGFAPLERRAGELKTVLDEVVGTANRLS